MRPHYPIILGIVLLALPAWGAWNYEYVGDGYTYDIQRQRIAIEFTNASPSVIMIPPFQPYYYDYGYPQVIIRPRYYYRYYEYPGYYYHSPAPFRSYRYFEYPRYHSRYFYRAPDHYQGFTFRHHRW